MADLVTLSRLIGVSCGTISRVLNNDASQRVSAKTRQRILDGAREHNYRPNTSARALSSRKTGNVGFVVHNSTALPESNPSSTSSFIVAFERALHRRNHGLNLLSIDAENREDSFRRMMDSHRSFDALLFTTMSITRPMVDLAARHGIPTAAFRDPSALEWPTNYFHLDDQSDLYRSIEVFVENGCREIAVIDWSPDGFYSDHVVSDVSRQAMVKFGLKPCAEWFISVGQLRDPFYSQRDHGREATRKLLAGKNKPRGILAYNDMVAFGVLDVLEEKGLRPGRDVMVIGHGNVDGTAALHFPRHKPVLTTFGMCHTEMAEAVAETLVGQISDPSLPLQQRLFPSELILRDSTRVDS